MKRVLLVDDVAPVRSRIGSALAGLDAQLLEASDGVEALECLSRTPADVVVSDVRMPRMDGIELLRAVRDRDLPVILHSGYQDVEAALQAVRLGAVDFFPAPIDFERMRKRIEDCLSRQSGFAHTLLGASAEMAQLRSLVARLAGERSPLLISGETGVGKGSVARTLHRESPWADGPYLDLELSAFEGRGASAREQLAEKIELARGGSLVMYEISDASPALQAELVAFIKSPPSAQDDALPAPRLIASTRRDLPRRVAEGRFREDLWYHISGLRIHVPPLRERRADVDALVAHELEQLSAERSGPRFGLDDEGRERLRQHVWPGNVIELKATLRRMVILAGERRLLDRDDVEDALRASEIDSPERGEARNGPAAAEPVLAPGPAPEIDPDDHSERAELTRMLVATGGNVARVARRAGMPRSTLRYKIRRYRLGALIPRD